MDVAIEYKMNQIDNISTKELYKPEFEHNEYISMCGDVIVYRNTSNKDIFPWIKTTRNKGVLLLVRQINYDLQLLWTDSIPREFWFNRRYPTIIKIKDKDYTIVSSMTIDQEWF